jgi:ferredoxin-like protein FixX
MIPTQLLFLSFILILLVLFILLALDIDFLSRLFSHEEYWTVTKTSSHKNNVGDINRLINLSVESNILAEKLIRICPVNAITPSGELLKISEKHCLGYACSECVRLIHYNKIQKQLSK